MIYDKALALPTYKRRSIKRTLSLYETKDGAIYCRGKHFRMSDNGLVMAEGAEFVSALPVDCLGLRVSSGFDRQQFILRTGGLLVRIKDNKNFFVSSPNDILVYRAQDGKEKLIIINDAGVYFHDGSTGSMLEGMEGGTTACLAYERLLTAKDEFIHWSNPLEPENFSRSMNGAGYVELPSFEGKILQMIPFKDYILLIRERGVTLFRVKGEPLSYSAESMPCAFGRIFDQTMQLCGEKVIFLTEGGLCCFDGTHINRIVGCGFEEIDLKKSILRSASVQGIYYASVVTKDGENRLWVVDPEKFKGHFVCTDARTLIGGDELLFAKNGKLYRLTEKGLPQDNECARLKCERSLLGLSLSEKFLEGLSFDGEGYLSVEAISDKGRSQRIFGRAGERIKFPVPLRGTSFSFRIETTCESIRIKNLTFDVREESETWK